MSYHCRLYQHVHLDHGAEETVNPGLLSLTARHRWQHQRGDFAHCAPHELEDVPAHTLEVALLVDAGMIPVPAGSTRTISSGIAPADQEARPCPKHSRR